MILYTSIFVVFDFLIVIIDWVIYEDIRIFDINKADKSPSSEMKKEEKVENYMHSMNVVMLIDVLSWIIIPIILIWFKKN